nr:MAG TPA: hypothetical protein [Caudoviricetes sp.]
MIPLSYTKPALWRQIKKSRGRRRLALWRRSGADGGALPVYTDAFSRLFSALYTVHIYSVSQKACVFNGFAVLQIRHNLHFAE